MRSGPTVFVLAAAVLAASSGSARACRCDEDSSEGLSREPLTAKTAMIVRLVEKSLIRELAVQQSWMNHETVPRLDGSICALKLDLRRSYLLLSSVPPKDYQKPGMELSLCNSVALDADKAGDAIEKLNDWRAETAGSPNPSWSVCEDDSDCVQVRGLCGRPNAVNAKQRAEYRGWVKASAARVVCEKAPTKGEALVPVCRSGRCGLSRAED